MQRFANRYVIFAFFTAMTFCMNPLANEAKQANSHSPHIKVHQILTDGINGIDGLDNPRQVKVSPDGKYIYVTSGDDNSLLILTFAEPHRSQPPSEKPTDKTLLPIKVFKNSDNPQFKLEGASGLMVFDQGKNVAVASFYDSALSLFSQDQFGDFGFRKAWSDNLSYERVFKSKEPLTSDDTLGLLGAWDVAITPDNQQLFVASYQSNGISVFDIVAISDENSGTEAQSLLRFNRKMTSAIANSPIKETSNLKDDNFIDGKFTESLGKPVTLVFSASNNRLIVAGYEGNVLTVFSRDNQGKLTLQQTIKNGEKGIEHLLNPQKLVLSPDGKYLYVACAGSHAILVFEFKDNQYAYRQAMTHADGLTGVGSLALSPDGETLYAAGEADSGLLIFDVAGDGGLTFERTFQTSDNKIAGVSSIAASQDGHYLFLTLSKVDALYVLKLSKKNG